MKRKLQNVVLILIIVAMAIGWAGRKAWAGEIEDRLRLGAATMHTYPVDQEPAPNTADRITIEKTENGWIVGATWKGKILGKEWVFPDADKEGLKRKLAELTGDEDRTVTYQNAGSILTRQPVCYGDEVEINVWDDTPGEWKPYSWWFSPNKTKTVKFKIEPTKRELK